MNSNGHGDGIAAVAFQRLFFIQTRLQKQRITENRKHTSNWRRVGLGERVVPTSERL